MLVILSLAEKPRLLVVSGIFSEFSLNMRSHPGIKKRKGKWTAAVMGKIFEVNEKLAFEH